MKNKGCIILVIFLIILVTYILFQRYSPKIPSPVVLQIKNRLTHIDPSFSKIPIYIDDSAYTIDKRTIYLCLRDSETGEIFDINTLMYVTLHEIAHVITHDSEYNINGKLDDHGPLFRKNFSRLLTIATSKGVYDPRKPLPKSYCGAHRI